MMADITHLGTNDPLYITKLKAVRDRMAGKGENSTIKGKGDKSAADEPVKISSDAEYNKLKSGTPFVGPDGVPRRKP
jgi:hypothetical protein